MKIADDQIEQVLRQAPRPTPPPGLRDTLLVQAPGLSRPGNPVLRESLGSWILRWRSAIATSGLAVLALAVLGYQQVRLNDLRTRVQDFRAEPQAIGGSASSSPSVPVVAESGGAAVDPAEVARLRATVASLKREVESLEHLRAENAQLVKHVAAGVAGGVFTEAEGAALTRAREKAQSIACVNNLKLLGLAVRVWATDHNDMTPPDILSMTNEMGSPKVLTCPADIARAPAPNWQSLTAGAISYEYLAPGTAGVEPQRILFRCPIHGSVALCDGSVQMALAKTHPERFVERDGKLYLSDSATPSSASASDRMRERYGLAPAGLSTNPPAGSAPGQ
jgi:hypothetical protein